MCYHHHDHSQIKLLGQQEIQDLLHSCFEFHILLLLLVLLNLK